MKTLLDLLAGIACAILVVLFVVFLIERTCCPNGKEAHIKIGNMVVAERCKD